MQVEFFFPKTEGKGKKTTEEGWNNGTGQLPLVGLNVLLKKKDTCLPRGKVSDWCWERSYLEQVTVNKRWVKGGESPSSVGYHKVVRDHLYIYIYSAYIFDTTIFKVFLEFTIFFLLYILGFWPWGLWNFSSPTKDRIHIPWLEGEVLTTRPPRKSSARDHVFAASSLFLGVRSKADRIKIQHCWLVQWAPPKSLLTI